MIDVVLDPSNTAGLRLAQSQAVIFDVLRATSTIVTALSAGARAISLFDTLDGARAARRGWNTTQNGPALLAGEARCLKPADFDLGNSPREQVTEKVGGATLLFSTTNGTRAAALARDAGAAHMFAASLLNATATAAALLQQLDQLDTVLIGAGTEGKPSLEDTLGAGAILFGLLQQTYRTDLPFTDSAWLAYHAFSAIRERLPAALRLGQAAHNIINAGLEDDIDFCARLDIFPIIARIEPSSLRVTRE